jgi:hypothetical protein
VDASQLLQTLHAIRRGDFAARMPLDRTGLGGKIADEVNLIAEMAAGLRSELARVATAVGREGRTDDAAYLDDARGGWAECVQS